MCIDEATRVLRSDAPIRSLPDTLLRVAMPQPTVASAPPAASPQARPQPPQAAPAATPGAAGSEGARIAQRAAPKTASLEAITSAQAVILKSAEKGRKEGRGQLLEASRANADESEAATPA